MCMRSPLGGILTGGKISPKTAALGLVGSQLVGGGKKKPASGLREKPEGYAIDERSRWGL